MTQDCFFALVLAILPGFLLLVTNVQTVILTPGTNKYPRHLKSETLTEKLTPASVDLNINTTADFSELTHIRATAAPSVRGAYDTTLPGLFATENISQLLDEAHLYLTTEEMAKCARFTKYSPHGSKPHTPRPYETKPPLPPRRQPKPRTPRPYGTKPPLPPRRQPKPRTPRPYGTKPPLPPRRQPKPRTPRPYETKPPLSPRRQPKSRTPRPYETKPPLPPRRQPNSRTPRPYETKPPLPPRRQPKSRTPRPYETKPPLPPRRHPKSRTPRPYETKPPLPPRRQPKPRTPRPPLPSKRRPKTNRPGTTEARTYYELFAIKGSIQIEIEPDSKALRERAKCSITVRVPRGLSILLQLLKAKNARFTDSYTFDKNSFSAYYYPSIGEPDLDTRPEVSNYFHTMIIHVNADLRKVPSYLPSAKFLVHVRFEALRRFDLELHYTSGVAGFIQTPHYERFLPTYILREAYAHVLIPSGHMIIISFPWAEVIGCIKLDYETAPVPSTITPTLDPWSLKPRKRRFISVRCMIPSTKYFYNIPRLTVNFTQAVHCLTSRKTIERKRSIGFRMRFSFYNTSSAPQHLPDGTWNCSVPYWPSFRDHFLCNFQSECSGKEDEADCPYTTAHCGPGYFTAGDACFFLERMPFVMFRSPGWDQGSNLCLSRGGRLATLKTRQVYDDVRRILHLQNISLNIFYIGLHGIPSTYSLWYRSIYQWTDGTMAFDTLLGDQKCERDLQVSECGYFKSNKMGMQECERFIPFQAITICEKTMTTNSIRKIVLSKPASWSSDPAYVTCPTTHLTHTFLACDFQSHCFSTDAGTCSAPMTPQSPSFRCRNLLQNIPYTLVCDHRSDCADSSDEDFCDFQSCGPGQYSCRTEQCIPSEKHCDGWRDCYLGEDEMKCVLEDMTKFELLCLSPPAVIDVGHRGMFIYEQLGNASLTVNNTHSVCPETHFQCPDNGFCLPVFLRCNGVFDCTYHEDEADCDIYTYICPGFYQCRASTVCVHQSHVCDGRPHCPQHDDELLCDLKCPVTCVCRGLAFFCSDVVHAAEYPALRYLVADGTNMTLADVQNNHLLIFLSLARCFVTDLGEGRRLPNLISLDVSDNYLPSISDALMNNLPRLKELFLSGNSLLCVFDGLQGRFPQIQTLHMSRVYMPQLNASGLAMFPNLHTLNLSQTGIDKVLGNGFRDFRELRTLDLRGCPMTQFPREMFQRLSHLQNLFAQSFHFCCPTLLPANFNMRKCIAPVASVSSCDNILGSVVHAVSAYVFAVFTLVANISSLVYRTVAKKTERKYGFSVFVTNLSVSNFLMGAYLVVIIFADRVYHGMYLWNDITWRYSTACSIAGLLSILSSEASALIMAVITFDRFLVLFFPLSRLQFGVKSAQSASCLIWILSLLLTSVPLLPRKSRWQWYSQTGICIPLLLDRTDFPGHVYFFSIVIVFNFILFVFVGLGQLLIYCYLRLEGMSLSSTKQKNKDMAIARRFTTVAVSNFLCWFTIGLLGLLASNGVPVSHQVNVSITVFVMPLNSALGPVLYATNVIVERRRRAFVEQMRKFIEAQLKKKP